MITSLPPSPIQETVVGDPLVIDCIATTPVAVDVNLLNFTWISPGPGGDMITNDSRITIHPTIAIANMYVSSLQFNHLIISDGGTYMCNVRFFDVMGSLSVVMDPPDCECVLYNIVLNFEMGKPFDNVIAHNYNALTEIYLQNTHYTADSSFIIKTKL